jgi:hypothetical protein
VSTAIDWLDLHSGSVLALATVALVIVTMTYVRLSRRMAGAGEKEAAATNRLAKEMTEDRELGVRPVLVCIEAALSLAQRPDGAAHKAPAVIIRNIGKGPAINVIIWGRYQGRSFEAHGITLTVGEIRPSHYDTVGPQPLRYVAESGADADPGDAVVGDADDANLYAYCGDLLGNRLRFNLRRSVDPPMVWRRGEPDPPWAHSWSASGVDRF